MHRSFAAALLAAALLAGCKSDSEKLIDLRTDLRDEIDGLYRSYGGGSLASQARTDAERKEGAEREGASTAARLFGELDRSWFEGYCLAHGRGERPFNLSGRLEEFMKDPDHQEACRRAARLEGRIRDLEAKVGTPR